MPEQIVKLLIPFLGLAAFAGLLFVLLKYLELKKGLRPVAAEDDVAESRYQRREWLLDAGSEARFYAVMEEAVAGLGGSWRVFVQIPLSRLIEPKAGMSAGERQSCQNKIDRKTVDYVVCEAGSLRVRCAVELDGSSHNSEKAKKRDAFVEGALKVAGVNLVRFDRRGKHWGVQEVREKLVEVCGVPHSQKARV